MSDVSASERDAAKSRASRIAEAEAKDRAKREMADSKVIAEAKAQRAACHKTFAGLLADYMVANGVENPRVIDDAVVDALKAQAGL